MAKANRKATTTDIAIELTRRSTMAALFASAALCGPASAATVCPDDPIYRLIEEHKTARIAFNAAMDAVEAIEDRLPKHRAPRVQLGMTESFSCTIGTKTTEVPARPFYATERGEIARQFDSPDSAAKRAELEADWDRQEAECANPELGEAEASRDAASNAEDDAAVAMLTTPPTTLAGAVALLSYLAETNTDGEAFNIHCGNAGGSFSALVDSLIVTLAPLVRQ